MPKRPQTTFLLYALLILSLASFACSSQGLPSLSFNPTATPTQPPTSTSTPAPTQTPSPTDTPAPTATPPLKPGATYSLKEAGFSFKSMSGYRASVQSDWATVSSQDDQVVFTMLMQPAIKEQSLEEAINDFLSAGGEGLDALEAGAPYPMLVDDKQGLGVDLTGDRQKGRLVAVTPGASQIFFAYELATSSQGEDRWASEGELVFNAVLTSIAFFPPEGVLAYCPVSTDPTYGFKPENPIKVGGEDFEGPLRELAYLSILRGPKGQPVSYARKGSFTFNGVILDQYEVTYAGLETPIELYFDEYHLEDVQIPAGFTCGNISLPGAPSA